VLMCSVCGGMQAPQTPHPPPARVICCYRQLLELDLSHNALTQFPDMLAASCPNLHKLNLAHNAIRSAPNLTSCSVFVHATHVDLSCNKLIDIKLAVFPRMEQLSVDQNELVDVDTAANPCLQVLHVSHNALTECPNSWKDLRNLRELVFAHNPQLRALPPWALPEKRAYIWPALQHLEWDALCAAAAGDVRVDNASTRDRSQRQKCAIS
jgi:hypothetical protein